ncbi:MAG: AraC family transcriptional regulator [Candidatus Limivivens sp.]|nr:AraC family transcriptional regulator [Candidatus Limivivens sp.]
METIKAYIQDNFSDPTLSANTICQKFRISPSYLCHIYKECENQNITYAITRLRIEEATRLLTQTQIPVSDIALKVGYSDAHYFTKIFKKNKGVSPSDLRKVTQKW